MLEIKIYNWRAHSCPVITISFNNNFNKRITNNANNIKLAFFSFSTNFRTFFLSFLIPLCRGARNTPAVNEIHRAKEKKIRKEIQFAT